MLPSPKGLCLVLLVHLSCISKNPHFVVPHLKISIARVQLIIFSPERGSFPTHPVFVSVLFPNLPAEGHHAFLVLLPLFRHFFLSLFFCGFPSATYSLNMSVCQGSVRFLLPCHPTVFPSMSSTKPISPARTHNSKCAELYPSLLPWATLSSHTTRTFCVQ